jgi:hypothetical protein
MKAWNNQMNWELAPVAGDIRYNPDTQMLEVYDGNSWTVTAHKPLEQVKDTSFDEDYTPRDVQEWIDEKVKEKALNELFGVK